MKISIITPSYNQKQFLEKAILSIWTQHGDFDLEHIVADGGSTDGSQRLLQKYDRLFRAGEFNYSCRSFEFMWWSGKDRGQSDAINQGFARSSGEIIGWLNSDDTYVNNASLSAMLQPFVEDKADIVIANGHHIDEEDNILQIPCLINKLDNIHFQEKLETISRYNFILQPATLFRRSVWENCHLNEKFHYVMDWLFWIETRQRGFTFYKINQFTANNRLHGKAKTVDGGRGKYVEGLALFKQNNIWCLNRFYYFLYLMLLKAKNLPFMSRVIPPLIVIGKKARCWLINRIKFY